MTLDTEYRYDPAQYPHGDWGRFLMYVALATAGFLGLALLASCSTKREVVERTDTLLVNVTDTVFQTKVRTEKVKEYVDRWNDRIVTINLQGDTVKDVQKQIVYVEKDSHLQDSVDLWKSRCEALKKSSSNNSQTVAEPSPNLWQRVKDKALELCLIGVFVIMLVIFVRKHVKI